MGHKVVQKFVIIPIPLVDGLGPSKKAPCRDLEENDTPEMHREARQEKTQRPEDLYLIILTSNVILNIRDQVDFTFGATCRRADPADCHC